jgi:DNA-binding CsgD family transcriptional regulator
MIPAGLIDRNYEFFVHNGNLLLLTDGKISSFDSMPAWLFTYLLSVIESSQEITSALDKLCLKEPMERIRKFVTCRFGSCDDVPDADSRGNLQDEFFQCAIRGCCPHEGVLCSPIKAPYGYITNRELDVIQLIAEDLPNKLIADELDISITTVGTHIQHIHLKIGCHSNAGVVSWAARNGLLKEAI